MIVSVTMPSSAKNTSAITQTLHLLAIRFPNMQSGSIEKKRLLYCPLGQFWEMTLLIASADCNQCSNDKEAKS